MLRAAQAAPARVVAHLLRSAKKYKYMKCYYHRESDAIAVCKSCGRGLSADYAVDVGLGTACRGRCEAAVAELNTIIARSKTAYSKTGSAYRRSAVSILALGLIFTGFGVLPIIFSGNYGSSFMAVVGILFIVWSFFSFKSARQITSIE